MLPAVMTGRARPELKDALVKQRPLTALKVTRGILAWQRIGGVVPGLQNKSGNYNDHEDQSPVGGLKGA